MNDDKARHANLMRNLSPDERDKLIESGHNVIDLRPRLRQTELAKSYKSTKGPKDGIA